jgi:putrescine transport system substrate-binding protein
MRMVQSAVIFIATLALIACNGRSDQTSTAKLLNIYSWGDYIAPDTVANFEKTTGIKVRYDTYESNDVLETKLLTGRTNYDIVVPTDAYFARLARAGVFRALDASELSHRENLDPDILRRMAIYDPGNLRSVPYLWTTVGIGYDTDKTAKRLGSQIPTDWSLIFDPHNAAKMQDCGITVIDSPLDVIAAALLYLGKDPNSRDSTEITAASDVLMKIRPFIRAIESQQYISDLSNGSVCLSLGWSGDVVQARSRSAEAATGVHLGYFVPSEGSLIVIDMMAIPADAPHPHNAQLWMNYLMQPQVMADITNAVKYPNGNLASQQFVKPEMRSDPAIYPDAATRARLHSLVPPTADYARSTTRLWTRFRTGQ